MHTKPTAAAPSGIRRFLTGKAGIGIGAVLLVTSGVILFVAFSGRNVSEDAANRNFICAETNKSFAHVIEEGETYPILSPYTKNRTGWPAEKCFWTRDGKAKMKPTLVLLNEYVGKSGPTMCPDCGREVRGHNPPPPVELMEEAIQANRQE